MVAAVQGAALRSKVQPSISALLPLIVRVSHEKQNIAHVPTTNDHGYVCQHDLKQINSPICVFGGVVFGSQISIIMTRSLCYARIMTHSLCYARARPYLQRFNPSLRERLYVKMCL